MKRSLDAFLLKTGRKEFIKSDSELDLVNPDDLYKSSLERKLKLLLRNEPDIKFWDIVRKCGGAYPIDIRDCLEGLAKRGEIDSVDRLCSFSSPSGSVAHRTSGRYEPDDKRYYCNVPDSMLPLPHPLDYDWRFTARARKFLVSKIILRLEREGGVGVFGAPSLFLDLEASKIDSVLVDRNPLLVERLGAV